MLAIAVAAVTFCVRTSCQDGPRVLKARAGGVKRGAEVVVKGGMHFTALEAIWR